MSEIAKGMIVQLISGGPRMSVTSVGDYSRMGTGPAEGAKCTWFDAKNIKCEDVFDVAVLKESESPRVNMTVTRS
jgi:uncharacterized protein YodC (DUF2158 family)